MPPTAVLVADEPDDPDVLDGIAVGLRAHGITIQGVLSPAALRSSATGLDADVLVLDLHRSGVAGLDRLLQLRQRSSRPILLLTDDDAQAVVRGLRLGAEDAVRLPVGAEELALRIVAARRRSAQRPAPRQLVDGPLVVDELARAVVAAGQHVALTNRELDLLVHLLEHAGVACTRDELLRAVWGSNSAWQTPATVTEHVRRIRLKLGHAGVDAGITALRGAGYRYDGARLASG